MYIKMDRDWSDFKSLHSNLAGAREAFEDVCESLFRKMHADKPVSQVRVKQGDGGIDIFIGELGVEPITVIQCKFFLETFEASQKAQIRNSFETALNSEKFELKNWILCIPRLIDIDEHSWWFKWKNKKTSECKKESSFITLKNGNELIDLFKVHGLYNQVFKIEDSIKIQQIHEILMPKKQISAMGQSPKAVLFNNYKKNVEPFYLERAVDREFSSLLKYNSLWVFGDSGTGKTALINRNLIIKGVEYCYCDLSPVSVLSSNEVLEEILCRIEDTFNVERSNLETNKIKQIAALLCQTGQKSVVIVIDELSVVDRGILKNIAADLIKLVTFFYNSTENEHLKFVISTISNPREIVEQKSKASEHFQFLDCSDWVVYLENLFDLLNESLKLDLIAYQPEIIECSKNSPRILKSIFRKIVAVDHLNDLAIGKAIKLTVEEIVN